MTPIPPLDRTSPTFKDDLDAFFGTRIPQFTQEANALQANLSSLAAGGAYAIPYTVKVNQAEVGSTAGGCMAFSSAGYLTVDTKDARGSNVTAVLATLVASNSAVLGIVKLQGVSDPSKWIMYSLTGYSVNSGGQYAVLTTNLIGSSSAGVVPFVNNDLVILSFQRTGDKGDTGATSAYPIMLLRDQKSSGANSQGFSYGWNTRVLNTAVFNEFGGSLSNNQFTLPAGKYWIDARASAFSTGVHYLRLFNVSDSLAYDQGLNEFAANNAYPSGSTAELRTEITLASAKTFRIDHFVQVGNNGGMPASSGSAEIYAEVKITKVA